MTDTVIQAEAPAKDTAANDAAANDGRVRFEDLGLVGPILGALRNQGFTHATPIQAQAIPPALEGRDVLGIAQTGTGKTAAFALPALQYLDGLKGKPAPKTCRVLVLSPTRELASQIHDSVKSFANRMRLSVISVFGGVGKVPQARACARGVDILIATPGRLRDLMEDGAIGLQDVQILVLDEADRMLDMGFAPEVRRLAAVMPKERQTVLFSATMPKDIRTLAHELMRDPVKVEVTPESTTVDKIEQKVMFVDRVRKAPLLRKILADDGVDRVIVFTRTKRGADKVCSGLKADGFSVAAIHGDKTQGARKQALADFARGKVSVLVATDLAARGIDVQGITHVVNYDLPVDAENYVHRIGRTARNGESGIALSFCSPDEVEFLMAIQKATRMDVPVDRDHSYHSNEASGLAEVMTNRQNSGRGPADHGKPSRNRGPKKSGGFAGKGPKRSGKPGGFAKGNRNGDSDRQQGDRPHADRNGGDRNKSDRGQRAGGNGPKGPRNAGHAPRKRPAHA